MLSLLFAALAMALKDALGTMLVIAEARGKSVLAGAMDAGGDIATVLVTLFGAGEVITHGWTWHTAAVLGVIAVTSFFGTIFWTRVGSRIC